MRDEKIKKFVYDEVMFEIIFDEIAKFFNRRRESGDVNVLASRTLSVWDLEDAKRHLQAYKIRAVEGESGVKQVGL